MNLMLCDSCENRNVMCFNCERNHYYRESNRSHDKYVKREAIKEFAKVVMDKLEHPNNYTIICGKHFTTVDRVIEIVKAELN